ncbi:hypothetical protein ACFW0V_02605 [Micromonospora parva]|uniref:hypothetical protein n=1 Tax=Micromonospora parva TaxID=1464048 RepID=UPI00366F41BE
MTVRDTRPAGSGDGCCTASAARPGQPTASLLFLVGAGCVLLALGLAAGTRGGTTAEATAD